MHRPLLALDMEGVHARRVGPVLTATMIMASRDNPLAYHNVDQTGGAIFTGVGHPRGTRGSRGSTGGALRRREAYQNKNFRVQSPRYYAIL